MTTSLPPVKRKRGRPVGSKDSYQRDRSCSKMPELSIIHAIMPTVRELVDTAELNGYHKGLGKPSKHTQQAVERCVTRLLAAIKMTMDSIEKS